MVDTVTYNTNTNAWQDENGVAGANTSTFAPNGDPFIAAGTSGTRPDGTKWVVIDFVLANGKTMCHIVWYANSQPTSFDFLSFGAVQAMRNDDLNSVGITLP